MQRQFLSYSEGSYYSIGKALLLQSSTLVVLECMQVIMVEHITNTAGPPGRLYSADPKTHTSIL